MRTRSCARSAARPSGARSASALTFWQGLGLVGSVGWMVVLPDVDRRLPGTLDRSRGWSPGSSGRSRCCSSAWRSDALAPGGTLQQELHR